MTTPNHYTRWKIEPIEFIRTNNLDFARANIIKYIMRFDAKDGIKDLDKAQQYLSWLREDYLDGKEAQADAQLTLGTNLYRMEVSYPIHEVSYTETDAIKKAERILYDGCKEERQT